MPALHRAELEREVTEALHLSGVSGTVRLRADGLELQNPLGAARVALDGPRELDEFRDAAPSERRRRARELAGLLAEARTTRRAAGASHKSHSGFRVSMRSALAITVANLGLSTFFLVRIADRPEPVASGPSATATATASAPRDSASDARACGLALTKLRAGEVPKREEALGFVAELWLATPEPSPRAAVEGALPQVKGELGDDAGADIEVVDATLDARKLPGAIVRLRGASAALAFDPSGSARLGRMADALAGATHAELAALTLRCAHRTASPLGLWFRGARDGASVAAALLVGMGRAPKGDAADASALYPALRERLAIALEGGKLKEFVLSRGGDLPSTRPPPGGRVPLGRSTPRGPGGRRHRGRARGRGRRRRRSRAHRCRRGPPTRARAWGRPVGDHADHAPLGDAHRAPHHQATEPRRRARARHGAQARARLPRLKV
jgi:hypothetical protein